MSFGPVLVLFFSAWIQSWCWKLFLLLSWGSPVMRTGPESRSQFVLLLGAVVSGLEISTSLLIFVRQVVVIPTQTKPYNTLLAVLASFDNVLMLVPLGGTLRLVAFHLIFLEAFGCGCCFFTFVRHQSPLNIEVNSPRIFSPVLDL